MIYISHRGNLSGPKPEYENTIQYIQAAFVCGFDVEIDVREKNGVLYLGHDEPQERMPDHFLYNKKFWFHAKDYNALKMLQECGAQYPELKYFWHQEDFYTLVSNQIIWIYPNKKILPNSIIVMPEIASYEYNDIINNCYGICTDYPILYRHRIEALVAQLNRA